LGTKDEKDDKDKKNTNMMRVRSTLSNMYTVLCVVLIALGIISLIAVMAGIHPFVMISESMHSEVPKNSLVLLSTHTALGDIDVGDNVAYVLGKVEAMHKVVSTDAGENQELIVKSLDDDGESVVNASNYIGKELLSIPQVGGWIRSALNYKWVVIIAAIGLMVVGCIPRKAQEKA